MIRKVLASLLATLFLVGTIGTIVTISGCNTMEGAGKDIESGGKSIKDEAREQRRY
jgi:entericidin B